MEYFQFEWHCLKILQKQNMLRKVSNVFKILRFRKKDCKNYHNSKKNWKGKECQLFEQNIPKFQKFFIRNIWKDYSTFEIFWNKTSWSFHPFSTIYTNLKIFGWKWVQVKMSSIFCKHVLQHCMNMSCKNAWNIV